MHNSAVEPAPRIATKTLSFGSLPKKTRDAQFFVDPLTASYI